MMRLTYNWLKEHVELITSPQALAALLPDIGIGVEKMEPVAGGDVRFDLEVTANRADCLGIVGIAREIAACTGARLLAPGKPPEAACRCPRTGGKPTPVPAPGEAESVDKPPGSARLRRECHGRPAREESWAGCPCHCADERTGFVLSIEEPRLCTRYVARLVTGVKVAPSPAWLRDRIEAIGLRAVNNVVDVTNYILFETGQPLHAFDCDLLRGNTIRVRLARRGEKMRAIDQRDYELDDRMLVIADAERPVAIAGVMGGAQTEVTERSKNILLEAACFNGPSIRRTSRTLALQSDSSYRFERNVDEAAVDAVSARAAELVQSVARGKIAELRLDCYPSPQERPRVALRFARLARLLGCEVNRESVLGRLAALGFEPQVSREELSRADRIEFRVPSYRGDVSREEDLVEEVARVIGYGSIPDVPRIAISLVGRSREQKFEAIARAALCAAGYAEALTTSFRDALSPSDAKAAREGRLFEVLSQRATGAGYNWGWLQIDGSAQPEPVGVVGRSGNVEGQLRLEVCSGLVRVLNSNRAYGINDVKLFEIAKRYFMQKGEPTERLSLAMLDTRGLTELKGAFEHFCRALGIEASLVLYKATSPTNEGTPGYVEISMGDKTVGEAGKRGQFRAEDDGNVPFFCLEVDFDLLCGFAGIERKYKPFSRHPAVVRDLAYVFPDEAQWRDIEEHVRKSAPPFLEEVRFFDEYRGRNIPAGRKSVAFSLVFRAADRTLSGEEVNAAMANLMQAIESRFGAVLRGKGV